MMNLRHWQMRCPFGYSEEARIWQRELDALDVQSIILDPVADRHQVRMMHFLSNWKLDSRCREAVIYVRRPAAQATGCARQGLC